MPRAPRPATTQRNITTYPVRQRRGLFGGLFRRRNRVVYPGSPTGRPMRRPRTATPRTGYTTYYTPGTYTDLALLIGEQAC